ncbi:hypothetical protein ACWD5V_37930 [Streptomyces sp. NPDC002523]
MALNRDRACRMCWLQRARMRRASGDPRLSYARALESGWVQLSFAGTRPQERRPAPAGAATGSRQAPVAPVAPRQLVLFPTPQRTLAAAVNATVAETAVACWLQQELTGWASSRGWSRSTLARARRGLHILLAVQDTPGAPVPASLTHQLTQIGLPARLLSEFLTAQHFADDDRVPATEAFFARTTAHLPEPMTGQLAHWFTVRLHGHTEPPRSQPRSPIIVRHQLLFSVPVFTRLAAAGTHDLANVSAAQLREHLAACRLTGTDYTHTASGLRSVFTTLHAHRITTTNPAAGLQGSISWASSFRCQWCKPGDLAVGADAWCSSATDMTDDGACRSRADCYSGCWVCAGRWCLPPRSVGVWPERRDAFLNGGDEDPFRTACEEVEE